MMSRHHYFQILLFTAYIVLMTAVMIWQGIGIDPSRYVFVLFIPAFFFRRARTFLLDWIPFIFILLSYDFLRGLAPFVNSRVNFTLPLNFDKLFGGQIPTITLQSIFYHPEHLSWIDYGATLFYFLHFALPLSFGFILWMLNKAHFRKFIIGLVLLSYAGWITYVIFPAAPPWMASQHGYVSGVVKILDQTLQSFPEKLHLPSAYHDFNPNPVAAVPSMHAAYPFLVLLFGLRFFGKKFWFFLPYCLGLWFSIIYLGEHYLFDALTGIIYAAIFYLVAMHAPGAVKFQGLYDRMTFKEKRNGKKR